MRDYLVGLLDRKGGFRQVVPTTQYYARASELTVDDNLRWGYSDVKPDYQPAALSYRRREAWIHDNVISIAGDQALDGIRLSGPDYPSPPASVLWQNGGMSEVRWLPDGSALRVVFSDGSVGRCSPDGHSNLHRFLLPAGVRSIELEPSGKHVLVLYADGRVDAWDLEPFGIDGWVGSSNDPARLSLPPAKGKQE